jgi:dTDP-4-amino-4,6-dideoxygalactose transaminase
MIPIFSNTLGAEEAYAVQEVFESRWLGRGQHCAAFEDEFAAHLGADHALLFNCCTAAVYVGLRALGVGPGDEAIVSTVNFVACANAVVDLGATPVFADVDPHTLNILPSEIERLRGGRIKGVVMLHYGGHPAPMDEVLCAADGLFVFEDSANSVASTYKGHACGTLGDAGAWSFDAMKVLVMGDGGALWVKDEEVRARAEVLRYLGLSTKRASGTDTAKSGKARWWEFELDDTAGRHISNDVLAAVGRIQLHKLPGFVARRKEIWRAYQRELLGVGDLLLPPEPLQGCESSYYLYWVQTGRRDGLAAHLYENGVYTTFRYYPLHLVEYYDADAELPGGEFANQVTLCLPLHQNLTDADVDRIIAAVKEFYRG